MDVDGRRESWNRPSSPLLHTKGKCGAETTPVLNIPEDAEDVEIILNNLSRTAHNIHLHGMKFAVTNIADFEWCNVNRTSCFLMPKQLNPCPSEDRGFADVNHTSGLNDLYWGCKYVVFERSSVRASSREFESYPSNNSNKRSLLKHQHSNSNTRTQVQRRERS